MESRRLFFVAQMFSPIFFSADRFRFVIFVSFPQTMAMCKYKLGDAEWSGDLRILKGGICSRGADPHLRSMGFLWSLKTSVRVPGNLTVPIYPPPGPLGPPLSQPMGWWASQHYTWFRAKWSPPKIEHCPQKWEAICKKPLVWKPPKNASCVQKKSLLDVFRVVRWHSFFWSEA